jgi:hypothetical protein
MKNALCYAPSQLPLEENTMSDSGNARLPLLTASLVDGEWARVFGGAYFSFYFSFFSQSLPAGQDAV